LLANEFTKKINPLMPTTETRVSVADLAQDTPVQKEDGALSDQRPVKILSTPMKRIVAILQRDDEARVHEHGAAGHS